MSVPRHAAILTILLNSCLPVRAELTTGEHVDTGLRYWQWQETGILFRLTQRLPDQTRAFFAARGFDKPAREKIALACVFQSEFRNIATDNIELVKYDLSEWRVQIHGKTRSLLLREDWESIWQKRDLPRSARIAFEWALLPSYQELAAGDYNWGMTAYGLPPGAKFDLTFSWRRGDRYYSRRIENIQCPPDIHPQPE